MGIFDHEKATKIFNLIICGEIMIAAIAQSYAFSFEPFIIVNKGKSNLFKSLGHALTMNDIFIDAHNSFIDDGKQNLSHE